MNTEFQEKKTSQNSLLTFSLQKKQKQTDRTLMPKPSEIQTKIRDNKKYFGCDMSDFSGEKKPYYPLSVGNFTFFP